jgi:isopentenyldiphosphate isomerase
VTGPGAPGEEAVEVVDGTGTVERVVTRAEMRARRLRHRCVYIVVVDSSDQVVVHRRAPWKDVWPDRWDLAFGGVVAVGEDWSAAAHRELAEEAGIATALQEVGGGTYDDDEVAVIGRLYVARHDGPFTFPDGEVTEVERIRRDEVVERLVARSHCPDSVTLARAWLHGGPGPRAASGPADTLPP